MNGRNSIWKPRKISKLKNQKINKTGQQPIAGKMTAGDMSAVTVRLPGRGRYTLPNVGTRSPESITPK